MDESSPAQIIFELSEMHRAEAGLAPAQPPAPQTAQAGLPGGLVWLLVAGWFLFAVFRKRFYQWREKSR
jgi:hypothetical protein